VGRGLSPHTRLPGSSYPPLEGGLGRTRRDQAEARAFHYGSLMFCVSFYKITHYNISKYNIIYLYISYFRPLGCGPQSDALRAYHRGGGGGGASQYPYINMVPDSVIHEVCVYTMCHCVRVEGGVRSRKPFFDKSVWSEWKDTGGMVAGITFS